MSNRLIIDWRGLKEMGWPYSRTHTWRLIKAGKFPEPRKLGADRNSHPVWIYKNILAHLESLGLAVTHDNSP